MTLFFKPNPQDPAFTQSTKLTKALSILCTAGMLNVITLPAQAAATNDKIKADLAAKQSLVGNDAYDKLVNLTAKYQLEQANYQEQRQEMLAGRSIYKKTIDGITSLFTDDSEVIETVDPELLKDAKSQVLSLQARMNNEQKNLIAQLSAQTRHMQQGNFDKQDFIDQRDLINEINARHQTLNGLFKQLSASTTESQSLDAISAINTQIQEWQPKQQQTDVENLPWGMPDSDVRKPIVSEADSVVLRKANYNAERQPYSAVHQWRDTEYRFGQMLLGQTAINTDFNKVAGLAGQTDAGNWTVLNALPAQVQPADLTQTPDIQITQAIIDKATELDHNPADIYKWVHDNIQYMPTYGSIQGSDYTLQTKRGNAFDTASLLIALLRASDIPARYVYGTVDIPAEQAMDWVGGVNNINAAQNLLGQGGVPNVGLTNGSVATHLRMEHVWVEANINAISRGMANNDNQTQWIPLDASYKSYTRTDGIDLAKAVPFDAEALIKKAEDGAVIDEAAGSVKNLNQGAVNQAIEDYQAQVKAYIEQNHANAKVGDVLGTSTIKPYNSSMLSPVLPYQVRTVVSDYQELPDSMRHYFILQAFQDVYEKRNSMGLGQAPNLHIKIPTVDLQGKPLALSFKPATKSDEDKIEAMMPQPDADGNVDPNRLPSYFPRSITMAAEITLNGQTLKTGNYYPFGTEVDLQLGFQSPSTGSNTTFQNTAPLSNKIVRAGEYIAVGYNLQGISQQQLENTKNTLEAAKDKIEQYKQSKEASALTGITKHDLTGAMMQAGVQSYFALNQVQDDIAAKQVGNMIKDPFMSYGSFATYVHPTQRYGIIFGASPKGVQMDIDQLMYTAVSTNNDRNELTDFIRSQGPRQSANEHLIPEQLFDDPDTVEKEVEGVSAVKAIQIAASEGQTIYTITQANYAEVLPKLQLSSTTLTDIRNAVNAGREVTTHEKVLSYKGWRGAGYIIIDPNSGAGAYLIEGGANGGIAFFMGALIGYAITLAFIGLSSGVGAAAVANPAAATALISIILPTLALLTAFIIVMIKTDKQNGNTTNMDCFWAGVSTGGATRGLIAVAKIYELLAGAIGLFSGTWSSRSCFI